MTMRERVTWAVVAVLALVGGWFVLGLRSADSLAGMRLGSMIGAVVMLAILTSIGAGVAALIGNRSVDERDHAIALKSQGVRGYFYLVLAYGVLFYAIAQGDGLLANGLFAAILGIELIAGLVMVFQYRRSA